MVPLVSSPLPATDGDECCISSSSFWDASNAHCESTVARKTSSRSEEEASSYLPPARHEAQTTESYWSVCTIIMFCVSRTIARSLRCGIQHGGKLYLTSSRLRMYFVALWGVSCCSVSRLHMYDGGAAEQPGFLFPKEHWDAYQARARCMFVWCGVSRLREVRRGCVYISYTDRTHHSYTYT